MGGVLVLAFGLWLLVSQGFSILGVVVLLVGVAALVVLALDMPLATRFDALGLERRALLRQHHIPWDQILRIRRGRAGVIRNRKQNHRGGLVAWVGQRPYVLTDAIESQIEFDQLRSHLGHELADRLGVGSQLRPLKERPPTWSYRSKKWRPDI